MFIEEYFKNNPNMNKLARESGTFAGAYEYWRNVLSERAMHLFHWKNTYEVPEHEIELCIMFNGISGVTDKYKKKLSIFNGNMCGNPTQYYDIFEDFAVHSPIYTDILKIGKEIVVIKNNSLRNSIYPLVHRYAIMLAHTEVSLINTLINGRDSGGIPIASTESQKQAIENYRNSLCNGKVTSILDPAFSGVQFLSVNKNTTLSIKDLMEVRQNLLESFYADLGVKSSREKKGNMIDAEVHANDSMLMLNLSDMLENRQKGCEEVNKLFGTHWEVELAPELQYFKEIGDDGYAENFNKRPLENQ